MSDVMMMHHAPGKARTKRHSWWPPAWEEGVLRRHCTKCGLSRSPTMRGHTYRLGHREWDHAPPCPPDTDA